MGKGKKQNKKKTSESGSFTRGSRPLHFAGNNPTLHKPAHDPRVKMVVDSIGEVSFSCKRLRDLFIEAVDRHHRLLEKMRVFFEHEGPEETLLRILDWLNVYADNTNAVAIRCIRDVRVSLPRMPKLYMPPEFYSKPVCDLIVDLYGEETTGDAGEYGLLAAQKSVYGDEFMEEYMTDLAKVRLVTPDAVYLGCMEGKAMTEPQKGEWSDAWERFTKYTARASIQSLRDDIDLRVIREDGAQAAAASAQ